MKKRLRFSSRTVMVLCIVVSSSLLAFSPAFAIAVGEGSPNSWVRDCFVECYNRVLDWGIPTYVYAGVPVNYVHRWGPGWVQDFCGGRYGDTIIMLRDGSTKAYCIWGANWSLYRRNPMPGTYPRMGGIEWLGYPIGNIRKPTNWELCGLNWYGGGIREAWRGGSVQHFEFGYITYTNGLGSWWTKTKCLPFANGELLKGDRSPAIYVYFAGTKHHIPDPTTFNALGYRWDRVRILPQWEMDAIATGVAVPPTIWGQLIRSPESPAVFIAWGGRQAICNPQTLTDLRGDARWGYDPWRSIVVWQVPGVMSTTPLVREWNSERWPRHVSPYKGQCTWYVQQRRKCSWSGNAKDWDVNARNQGFLVAKIPPVPGCIMVWRAWASSGPASYGHVALVEAVDYQQQTITITHMNYRLGTVIGYLEGMPVRRATVSMWDYRLKAYIF